MIKHLNFPRLPKGVFGSLVAIIVVLSANSVFAAENPAVFSDTAIPHLSPPNLSSVSDSADTQHVKTHSALGSAALSLIFPGAGQLYCRKPVKSAIFFAGEAIAAGVTINRYWFYKHQALPDEDSANALYSRLMDSSKTFDTDTSTTGKNWVASHLSIINTAHSNIDLKHADCMDFKFTAQQSIAWCLGIHVFNVFDALQSSGKFADDRPRNPGAAAALSAIPLLGLGQVYNGSLSKTGLILMGEGCLAYMAWNNQQLLKNCDSHREALLDSVAMYQFKNPSLGATASSLGYQTAIDQWASDHDQIFHRRNAYLWYLVLLYFYGVGDAAVDAGLHNFKAKMKLQPIVGPTSSGRMQLGLNLAGDF